MPNIKTSLCIAIGCLSLITALSLGTAKADPPTRVARLSSMSGPVTFSPAGEQTWAYATLNRPLVTGDRLWADTNGKAELQLGRAAARIGTKTSITLLNLDNKIAQFQLAQGTFNLRIWKMNPEQLFEIDTPNLAFVIHHPGDYRIDVDAEGNPTTTVMVRSGHGEAFGENASQPIEAGQAFRFTGANLQDYQAVALAEADDFDRWTFERNNQADNAQAHQRVSSDMIGYEDLDSHGTWQNTEDYNQVWVPSNVPDDWAPYRDGHWAWIDPWGWTWIDNQPWGFAPFHYGRWVYYRGTWCWVPGPPDLPPVYAPALVVFVGGGTSDLYLNSGAAGIAWFPLAPGEVYWPSYPVSQVYFTNINTSNTRIYHREVEDAYHHHDRKVHYHNRYAPNAVTAVPTHAFINSQPVARSMEALSKEAIAKAQVTHAAKVAPAASSIIDPSKIANLSPAKAILTRPVIAKTTPPPPPVAIKAQLPLLTKDPGKPLNTETLNQLRSAAPAMQKTSIKVVTPTTLPTTQPGQIPQQPPMPSTHRPDATGHQQWPAVPPPPTTPSATQKTGGTPAPIPVPHPPQSKPIQYPTTQPKVVPHPAGDYPSERPSQPQTYDRDHPQPRKTYPTSNVVPPAQPPQPSSVPKQIDVPPPPKSQQPPAQQYHQAEPPQPPANFYPPGQPQQMPTTGKHSENSPPSPLPTDGAKHHGDSHDNDKDKDTEKKDKEDSKKGKKQMKWQ